MKPRHHNSRELAFPRSIRRKLGISLAAAATFLFASQAQAFNAVRHEPTKAKYAAADLYKMSLIGLKFIHKGVAVGGGGGGSSLTFNTAFGSTDATTGKTTFPLGSGAKRIWVNSKPGGPGSDANNGLSHTTPKLTFNAAKSLFLSGFTAGDQLMLAGGEGQVYDDDCNSDLGANSGQSLTYLTAELCYDSTDPTNTALYGWLTGAKQPVMRASLAATGAAAKHFFGDSGGGGPRCKFIGISGIFFDGQGADNFGTTVLFQSIGKRGIIVQNCRFKETELKLNIGSDLGTPTTHDSATNLFSTDIRVTRCSFWGQWNSVDGNASGLYLEGTNAACVEDNVFFNCGWRIGANRDDPRSLGGPHFLGHGSYISPMTINNVIRRNIYGMSALDGFNFRGGGKGDCIVSIWDPKAATLGGYSGNVLDALNGMLVQVDDLMVLGSSLKTNSGEPANMGFHALATVSGSYLNNLIAGDNSYHSTSGFIGDGDYFAGNGVLPASNTDTYLTIKNSVGYNFGTEVYFTGNGTPDPTHIHLTYTSNAFDQAPNFGTGNSGNTISSAASLPSAKTVLQAAAAHGFSSVTAWINAMLYRPDLLWAQSAATVWSAAYGKTLTNTPPCSVPSIGTDTPTVIFASTAGTLTLSDSTFAHASAKTVNILGCPAGWSIVGTTLPTGFTVKSADRQLVYDGSGTAGTKTITLTHSLENVGTHTDTLTVTAS